MLYLAIDQHRKQLTVNLRNETGDVLLKRPVSTEWERVRKFLSEVRQQSESEGGFVAILEVCGFNDWLLKLLWSSPRNGPRRRPIAAMPTNWGKSSGSTGSDCWRARRFRGFVG
jgi:hypothetical protein